MRFKLFWLLALLVGSVYFYNTIWFQSFFLYKSFYENIVDTPFDVTRKGATITIPIQFKYKTCYDLGVSAPDPVFWHKGTLANGHLGFRFISQGKILLEGISPPPSRHSWTGGDDFSKLVLMVFDLPCPGATSDLTLELEVIEPFTFLEKYKGATSIVMNPAYIASVGKCYNDDLRIDQPE